MTTPAADIEAILGIDPSTITTIIDEGVEVTGFISCKNGKAILVSGTVNGDIVSNGSVIINKSAVVRGSVQANRIKLAGAIETVDGRDTEVIAREHIAITKTGRLKATVLTYAGLDIEFGSFISASMNPRKDGGVLGSLAL